MDLTATVTAIGDATTSLQTVGVAVLGVLAALFAYRLAKRALAG